MSVHHLEQLSRTVVERNRVGSRLEDDRRVLSILIREEAPATMVLRFVRTLGVIESVGGLTRGAMSALIR